MLVLRVLSAIFLILALGRRRWAYVIFVVLALASFAARPNFHLSPHGCELLVSPQLALFSFTNFPHIILFAFFFGLSRLQFSGPRALLYAAVATITMGVLVELAEGFSGQGHCRLRDLLPDAAGAAVGIVIASAIVRGRERFTPL